MFNPHKFVYWVRSLPFSLFMYLKEKQYKIAMILLCPVQGPWASSLKEIFCFNWHRHRFVYKSAGSKQLCTIKIVTYLGASGIQSTNQGQLCSLYCKASILKVFKLKGHRLQRQVRGNSYFFSSANLLSKGLKLNILWMDNLSDSSEKFHSSQRRNP